MKTFVFHASFSKEQWTDDERIIAVKANTESEALGLILQENPELKREDVETVESYCELKPLQPEEVMRYFWEP